MTISLPQVKSIMKPGSLIKFNRNNIRDDNETIVQGQWDSKVHDLYRMAEAKVNGTTLMMKGTTEDDKHVNAVNIIYEEDCATMGSVLPPGIIYSTSFSGCVFYLYRGGIGHIYGVHANRSKGRLADPDSWFLKRGGKRIYQWDSLGKITPGMFGAVVVCLDKTILDIYALEMDKQKINKVVEHKTLKNWPSATMI